jgi:hypothetical protein
MDSIDWRPEWVTEIANVREEATEALNQRTVEGWEFVQACPFGRGVMMFFKRTRYRPAAGKAKEGKTLLEVLT